MKCSVCNNEDILKPVCKKRYKFMIYPFSKQFVCSNCESKYDVLLLFAMSSKIFYFITKRKSVIPI